MRGRAIVVLAASVAALSGMARATRAAEAPQGRVVQQAVDPKTGAVVRVYRAAATETTIEVVSGELRLQKRVAGDRSEVAVSRGRDQVKFVSTPAGITVSRGPEIVEVTRTHRERGQAARALLAASPAVHEAADLLGKLGLGPHSPVRGSLMLTRAVLLSTWDDRSGFEDLRNWTRSAGSGLRLTTVATQWTASQCWAYYAVEAIQAYDEYVECAGDLEWYDLLDLAGCALVYDVRAVGAFAWWLNCVSLMV